MCQNTTREGLSFMRELSELCWSLEVHLCTMLALLPGVQSNRTKRYGSVPFYLYERPIGIEEVLARVYFSRGGL